MAEEEKQQVSAAHKSWYLRVQSNMSSLLNVHHLPPTRVLRSVLRRVKNPGISLGEPKKASCREVFTAFWTLFIPYFLHRRTRCKAFFLLSVTMVFMYLEVSTGVAIAAQTKELQNSLVLKKDEFWDELRKLVLIIARLLPVLLLHFGAAVTLGLSWRKFLTQEALDMYISDKSCFYRLKILYGNLDNPDQRIAQDIGNFTRTSVTLIQKLALDAMKIALNSAALIEISPRLFYTLVGFSLLYTFVSLVFFAAPLMKIQRRVLAVEADLRYVLVRLREHAESVAFFRGYQYERQCSETVLDHVIWSSYKFAAIELIYKMITGVVQAGFGLMPMLVIAPMYFKGTVSFGTIQQSQLLFQTLLSGMMDLGKELNDIAKLGAESVRVKEIWAALEAIEKDEAKFKHPDAADDTTSTTATSSEASGNESSAVSVSDVEQPVASGEALEDLEMHEHDPELTNVRLQLACVTLYPPLSSLPLISNLTLTLKEGQSLLIEGPSGSGKSSLLRAIAGLCHRGFGAIHRAPIERCFFLPQTPYLCIGSLRDNVLYPARAGDAEVSNEQIRTTMRSLGIEHLMDRHGLDERLDFQGMLSGGEKQRLSFARLLLRPGVHLALLDEATSALDEENEAIAYNQLRENVHCYVSVGHRPALANCHSLRLQLSRLDGSLGCQGIVSTINLGSPHGEGSPQLFPGSSTQL
mmetsp:Transcript_32064/g.74904  ORF Transcript_32064/g.74904 Transcript_32064/m.74904 type:complete len:694 (+) Transcript_32064:46-2127(+)